MSYFIGFPKKNKLFDDLMDSDFDDEDLDINQDVEDIDTEVKNDTQFTEDKSDQTSNTNPNRYRISFEEDQASILKDFKIPKALEPFTEPSVIIVISVLLLMIICISWRKGSGVSDQQVLKKEKTE